MSNFALDDRMTDETKAFVTNVLKSMKPADSVHVDVNLSRKFRIANALRVNGSLTFDDVIVQNLKVTNQEDAYEIPIVAFIPKNTKQDSPITIFFHGGGWTFGSCETHFSSIASLASATQTIFLSVEYRLCPEVKFPKPLSDCVSVMNWVLSNKTSFSSAVCKVGLAGDSSGGHYAALIAHDFPQLIDYQILIHACLHVDKKSCFESEKEFTNDCYILVPEMIQFFVKNLIDNEEILNTEHISPLLKSNFEQLPQTCIIAAELDPLVDHSKAYFDKLQQHNVKSELLVINGVHHGFFSNPVQMKNSFGELQQHLVKFFAHI